MSMPRKAVTRACVIKYTPSAKTEKALGVLINKAVASVFGENRRLDSGTCVGVPERERIVGAEHDLRLAEACRDMPECSLIEDERVIEHAASLLGGRHRDDFLQRRE